MKTNTKELVDALRFGLPMNPIEAVRICNKAADRLEELQSDSDSWWDMAHSRKLQADAAIRELAWERALADRLAGCMAHLAAYDWFIDGTESHSVVCGLPPNQVREALAAYKEARP